MAPTMSSSSRPPSGGGTPRPRPDRAPSPGSGPRGSTGRPGGGGPRRPRPSRATIIKRRVVALLVLLALVALLFFGIAKAIGWVRGMVAQPATTETVTSTPTPQACSPADVELALAAQDAVVGAGGDAVLTMTNNGAAPCTLEAGADSLVLRVTSGGQPVWGSDVCTGGPAARPLLLDAGAASDLTLTWDGTVAVDICGDNRTAAAPGTYRYAVVLDGRLSAEDTFVVAAAPAASEDAPAGDEATQDQPAGEATAEATAEATEDSTADSTDG